jgi:hypothetical protein
MVDFNRKLEEKAGELVALVESTPDEDPPLLDRPDFVSRFNRLEGEFLGVLYEGQRHIWHATLLASRLGQKDRTAVELKVGPLFVEQGALGEVWRREWLHGTQTRRASVYRRLLRSR